MKKSSYLFILFCAVFLFFTYGCKKSSTPAPTSHDVTVLSDATKDGLVSSSGGTNTSSTSMSVGDNNINETYQAAVSFTLPTMPGTVTSATLWVYEPGYSGTPLLDMGSVQVSHITPNYSGNSIPYLIYSSNTTLGTICNSYGTGWYHLNVTAAVENDRTSGRIYSQFRLYCDNLSDNDSTWDIISFATGENTGNEPYLAITYQD